MERIYTINNYLKKHFGTKVVKLSIDGGFTCPNRDGTKGYGGCTFCSSTGSGELSSDIPSQMKLLSEKWPNIEKFLAYFQNHTNTYASPEILRKKYYDALNEDKICGIVIATRPDCLGDEIMDLLEEINKKHFMWIELGLQTIHDKTAYHLNRGYTLDVYNQTISKLNRRHIKYVTHLILGLPGETKDDMKASVQHICSNEIFGIKLHMLNLVKGSVMASEIPNYQSFENIDQYISTVCDMIELIPPDVTIHRLTGDVPRPLLISPSWSYKKRTILNGIQKELILRNSYQGLKFQPKKMD